MENPKNCKKITKIPKQSQKSKIQKILKIPKSPTFSSKFILDNMFPKGTLFTSTRIMYKNEKCNIKQIPNNYKNVHTKYHLCNTKLALD